MKISRVQLRRYAGDAALYLLGCIIYSMSVNVFTAPNNIVQGGLTGVATLLNYLFHLPIGIMILLMNVPLIFMAWRYVGVGFTVRTAINTALSSVIIDVTSPYVTPFHGNQILSVVFGGVTAGIGLGLIFMRGGTTGGSEIIARLLELRFPHITIGRLILLVDATVVVAAAVIYNNVENALYAIVMIYICSVIMDTLVYGKNKGKMLLIVTGEEEKVTDGILRRVNRGLTILKGQGGYTGTDRRVLLCAVRPSEVYGVRNLIYDLDPHAFIVIVSTDDVLGNGFQKIKEDH